MIRSHPPSHEVHPGQEPSRTSRPCGKGSRSLQPWFNSRPRSGVTNYPPPRSCCTVAGSRSASTFSNPHPLDTDEALVAAADYTSHDRASSELSGPTSDVSCPSRGWASVTASERQEHSMAVMARLPCFHVCYGTDHFLLDFPLLSTEVKHRIEVRRPNRFSRTELEAPRAVVNPHSEPLTLSPRARPTCPLQRAGPRPRYTGGGLPNRPQQS
jgi:hypothetical protein